MSESTSLIVTSCDCTVAPVSVPSEGVTLTAQFSPKEVAEEGRVVMSLYEDCATPFFSQRIIVPDSGSLSASL